MKPRIDADATDFYRFSSVLIRRIRVNPRFTSFLKFNAYT
jgi:hypothetical protein